MSEISPSVTVSIVSHGQWALARPLIDQLQEHCRDAIASILVTVNIPDRTEVDPQWQIPVQFIHNAQPKGFGANHNAAFQKCQTEWFLVLNPDLRLNEDPIAALIADANADVGLVAPRVVEPGKETAEPHRELLTPAELVRRRIRRPNADTTPTWVAGMFMLFRASAFKQVRGFDERYFMYVEDADICARLTLVGWKLIVSQTVHVSHDAQRASRRQWRALAWHVTSLFKWWTSAAFWRSLVHWRAAEQ